MEATSKAAGVVREAAGGGPHETDIAILGTGITAGLLACVLARQGLSVALVGRPPEAPPAGETTIPYTSALLQLIAARFDVPEVGHLADTEAVTRHVGPSSGVQRVLGFAYHHPGQEHAAPESMQFQVPKEHAESHLYRPDVDDYLLRSAVRYGASIRAGAVTGVEVTQGGAVVATDGGERVRARCVVDASVRDSVLVRRFDLREEPTRLGHSSRSFAAHMTGVRPYEDCVREPPPDRRFMPWSQGMLHHLFDGGWLWVVPFGQPTGQGSRLCSVGLNLADPPAQPGAEEAFRQAVARYPTIARQFEQARVQGEWVVTDLPYSARTTAGDRFCVVDEAAGDSDLLFSRRVTHAAEVTYGLARELLAAARDDDFSAARLKVVDELQQGLADAHDGWLRCAYTAFGDFHLFNAVVKVWLLGSIIGALTIDQRRKRFERTRDVSVLADIDGPGEGGSWYPVPPSYRALQARTAALCEDVKAGRTDPRRAGEDIFSSVRAADFVPPVFGFGDPGDLCYRLSAGRQVRTLAWLLFKAPAEIKALAKK